MKQSQHRTVFRAKGAECITEFKNARDAEYAFFKENRYGTILLQKRADGDWVTVHWKRKSRG